MHESNSGASHKSPRYYYTDPLAAAWMAKHHGMKLLADKDDEGGLVDAGARFIDCDDTFRELWQHDFSYLGKLFVHPDSLHLLEPRDGDLYATVHGCGWLATTPGESWKKQCHPFRIIQRNGIAFHWPESEAA